MARRIRRYDAHLVAPDPVQGSEIGKTRPCVVVSPDEINSTVRTVVIVPLTSTRERYAFRVPSLFQGREGDLAIDHIRSIDRGRLIRRLGPLDPVTGRLLADALVEMFAF